MKWGSFKVPVKVEHINEYLFSDTVQSKKKSSSDEISQCIASILFLDN